MKKYHFLSTLAITSNYLDNWDTLRIKNEPMLFSCDREHAYKLGGPITHNFLNLLDKEWGSDYIVDSRVHMSFKAGIFLAIPGWHVDDAPRGPNGQPDHTYKDYFAEHCMALVNSHIAPTEFYCDEFDLPEIADGQIYYKEWHSLIEKMRKNKPVYCPADRQICFFNAQSWHQAVPTINTGWRFFIRATRNTKRNPTNEIRKQVQVYLPQPFEGW